MRSRTIIRLVDQPTLQNNEDSALLIKELVHLMADFAVAECVKAVANDGHYLTEASQ